MACDIFLAGLRRPPGAFPRHAENNFLGHQQQGRLVRATDKVSEVMQETVARARQGAAEIGQLAIELAHEQIRHNLAIVTVIGRATNWEGITQVQADFVCTSLARIHLFTTCCLDLLRPSMGSCPLAWCSRRRGHQVDR